MAELFNIYCDEHPGCWWLWTAYVTDRRGTQESLVGQYEAWKKANATPCKDGVRTPSANGG